MAKISAPRGRKRKDPRRGVKRATYNIPDELDLKLHQEKIEKLSKGLDENGRPKPLTENKLKQLIRSAVREKWMYCNNKLAFREKMKKPDVDINSRRRWYWECNRCKSKFSGDSIECDHKVGENSFTDINQAHEWASAILNAGGEEDLQMLCTDCHSTKSAQDSLGCTWEEAVRYKKMMAWEKASKVEGQKMFLKSKGFTDAEISNKEKRRAAYIEFLKREGL